MLPVLRLGLLRRVGLRGVPPARSLERWPAARTELLGLLPTTPRLERLGLRRRLGLLRRADGMEAPLVCRREWELRRAKLPGILN